MKINLLALLLVVVSISAYAAPGYGFIDNMRNTSRLSDAEIERYLMESTNTELREALDQDNDGYADGTNKKVGEFIARMQVILICRRERLETLKKQQLAKRMYGDFTDETIPEDI